MPRGGARVRSGPPPDPTALRRERDRGEWTHLPRSGREGPPPTWPLSRATAREQKLWKLEWARPQAIMWESNHQEIEVALYVRALRTAESPAGSVDLKRLVRQSMDALGLTVPGLRANRWIIDDEEPLPAARPSSRGTSPAGTSARDRLKVVTGGA